MAASVAANTGCRGAAELLACAARRAERVAPANVDRTRRPPPGEALNQIVATYQVSQPRPRRHPVHDAARGISVPSVPIYAARRHRGRIIDRQPQPDPARTANGDVREYDRFAD